MIPRPNKYPGQCRTCGRRVAAEGGWLAGRDPETGRWAVECRTCADVVEEAERQATVEFLERDRVEAERSRQAMADEDRRRQHESEERYRAMFEKNDQCRRLIEELQRLERLGRTSIPKCLTTLGLTPPVTVDMVKTRYRELAKQAHPDAGGSAARFVALKTARDQALTFASAV